MKIAICIPSRKRPRLLAASLTCLQEMESGKHDVVYEVGYDNDDPHTGNVAQDNKAGAYSIPSRIITIGGIWNYLVGKIDADVYCAMIDDAFPITPHWDDVIARLSGQHEAFSWHEPLYPHNAGYPIATKAWIRKVGEIVPEHFPFWFMDTWFEEIAVLISGRPLFMTQRLCIYSKQEETQNLRGLSFWWGFFNATRAIRINQAWKISGNGMSLTEFTERRQLFINEAEGRDAFHRGVVIEELERTRGDKRPPSSRYTLARERAEAYLVKHGLTPWGGE